jgi:hypothetical protein
MPIQAGYIDNNGHPRITLDIWGPDAANIIRVDAVIDTGFTDFLMLPSDQALSLGIVPSSTASYVLADGSIVSQTTWELVRSLCVLRLRPLPKIRLSCSQKLWMGLSFFLETAH